MARIELRGKYAVGDHRFALVDDEDFGRLNQRSWKAKWNGGRNNIYAVRNELVDGKSVTVRMHREVLRLDRGDAREVDHLDHYGLNNQRDNLRIATRRENILNARRVTVPVECRYCGKPSERIVGATGVAQVEYCSRECAAAANKPPRMSTVHFPICHQCNKQFTARNSGKFWCSNRCRKRASSTPRLSMRQRVLLALSEPRSTQQVALHAEVHVSDVRRVLGQLKAAGIVTSVAQRRSTRGRPPSVYSRVF